MVNIMSEMGSLHRHHRIITAPIRTEVGSILLGGLQLFGFGVNRTGKLRAYDGGALILVTRGEGIYKDAKGKRTKLKGGDAILVFPGMPHWYGPQKGQIFDEVYVAFDGPMFDSWFSTGLLDPNQPIRHLGEAIEEKGSWLLLWIEQFAEIRDTRKQIQALIVLLQFFGEIALGEGHAPADKDAWLSKAKAYLSYDLKGEIDLQQVAKDLGMGYEAFRKKFQLHAKQSPFRFRNERKVEAAKHLIRYAPQSSNREVAEALGFSDEFHFSKRFRQIAGVSPNAFRKSLVSK
jgi:AraC-like DNA-binding protein